MIEVNRRGIAMIKRKNTPQISREPRQHTISTVFIARADGTPKAADVAAEIGIFKEDELFSELLMFDHAEILADYFVRGSNQRSTSKRRTK